MVKEQWEEDMKQVVENQQEDQEHKPELFRVKVNNNTSTESHSFTQV